MSLFDHADGTIGLGSDVDRLVVVAPHPDDEVLACGLLLADASERKIEVAVVAVTDGESAYPEDDADPLAHRRRVEQLAALSEVGVAAGAILRLGLPDGEVASHPTVIEDALNSLWTPRTLIVAPSQYDWHPDHEACGLAVRRFGGARGARRWSSVFWAHHHPERLLASGVPLLRFEGTEQQCAARRRAVACHRSQFRHPTGRHDPILTDRLVAHLDIAAEIYLEEE